MHRAFAKFAIFVLALVAALPLLARTIDQTAQGFVAADYRDAYRLEAGSQRIVLRAAFAHSSEAAKSAGGAAYREAFPGVQALRSESGSEVLTISDPSALVAYDVAEMSGVVAAVHDGRGVRFVPQNVREAGLAFSEPQVVDAVGRPSFGARWVVDGAQIRLQIEDAMLRYPIRVTYAQGERGAIGRTAEAAKRTLQPKADATGFVTGVVTDAGNSAPLTTAVVDLYDSAGNYFNSYGTDGTGHYTAEVEAGTWYVVASASGYGTKLYNNINCTSGCTVTSGTPVSVAASGTTPNINFSLASNVATLSGNVVGPGAAPLSTIFVFIYDSAGNALAATLTDGAGNWTAQVSPGGTLFARTFNFIYPGLTDQVYNGIDCSGCNVTSGTAINAPNGTSVANINFSLHTGATISGTVTDGATAAPLTSAFVSVYTATGALVTTLNTDSSGAYSTFTGLAAGTYFAKANAAGYDGELYDNIPCPTTCSVTSGTGIAVTAGQTRTGVDFSLASAQARITGRVLSSTNAILGGVLVQAFNASGNAVAGSLSTFDDGSYELVLPSPGSYYVKTQNSVQPGYIDQLYNGIDCTACAVTGGTAVNVAAGVTAENIDFHLSSNGGSISGSVFDAVTTQPLVNAVVHIYGTSGNEATSGVTNSAGAFNTFSGLAAGTYYATASLFGYDTQLYDNIDCATGCNPTTGTAITVQVSQNTGGIVFNLTSSFARIAGKVTDASNNNPLSGVDVLIYDGAGDLAGSATTDASGNYIVSLAAGGTYYAVTSATAYPQFVNQLYDHLPCNGCDPTTGTAITATIGAVTDSIDFGLASAGCAALSIQPPALPDGTPGGAYSATLTLANAGGPATFSLLSGLLPPALTLSSGGVISGTTTTTGVYTFTVSATDGTCTTTREYTIEVTAPTTTTTLTANVTSGTYPLSITFTATVDPSAATGTVTFRDGVTTIGTATLSGGIATFTTSSLNAGTHEITATYGGDSVYLGSTSSALEVTIAKATPVFSNLSAPTIVVGTATTAIGGKLAAGAAIPPGNVTITVNGNTQTAAIQADGTFSANFNTSAFAIGTYAISFSYAGSTNFNSATGASTLKVTYATTGGPVSNGNGNGTIPMRVELHNASGANVSSASITVTAYGVRLVTSSTYLPPQANGNGGLQFDYQNAQGGSYKWNLSAKNLADGDYMLAFTVSGDPVIHEVPFKVGK